MSPDPLRLLIVDDDPQLRRLLAKAFTGVGYQVAEAEDGRAAMDVFRAFAPHVVLTDIIMPRGDGLETIVQLRALAPDLPIVAMSGGGRVGPEEFLSLAQTVGATTTVRKPFTVSQIRALVAAAADVAEPVQA